MTTMDFSATLAALRRLRVETGSLVCFGCGHEHNCSTHGCAILRNAVEHMEAALSNYRIEPSQGTHFFQNLTSFGVGYFTINPFSGDGYYDEEYLNSLPAETETQFLRMVRFDNPVRVEINGKKSKGLVLKPELRAE